ncbi:MAG: helix-turn-helix domain-containing protein [Pseudomonadota bacterium]
MKQLTYSISDVQRVSGLGRTKIYELIKSGELPVRKVGSRSLVLVNDLQALLEALPIANSVPQRAAKPDVAALAIAVPKAARNEGHGEQVEQGR